MIRFDTFIFDYDTKNVIVFSNKIVLLPVRQALPLTVCVQALVTLCCPAASGRQGWRLRAVMRSNYYFFKSL